MTTHAGPSPVLDIPAFTVLWQRCTSLHIGYGIKPEPLLGLSFLTRLRCLEMHMNSHFGYVEYLPDTWTCLRTLQTVHLHGVSIVPSILAQLPSLTSLSVCLEPRNGSLQDFKAFNQLTFLMLDYAEESALPGANVQLCRLSLRLGDHAWADNLHYATRLSRIDNTGRGLCNGIAMAAQPATSTCHQQSQSMGVWGSGRWHTRRVAELHKPRANHT